jgi:hypothetical protein
MTEQIQATEPRIVRVAILTPYLTNSLENIRNPGLAKCEGCGQTETCDTYKAAQERYFKFQVEKAGFNPENFRGVKSIATPNGLVILETPRDHTLASPTMADFAIAGSTEPGEDEVEGFKGSGLVVARYSMFYGNPSRYSGRTPEQGGYALDIPKEVSTVKAILSDDRFLDAIVARDESRIREAVEGLNKSLAQPVLITPYLSVALSQERRR